MTELPSLPFVRAADVRRDGESERRLARAAQSGELSRVRRGAYADSAFWQALSPEDRHLIRVLATSAAARGMPVFSHESAAVAWRMPIVGGLPARPQITVPPGSGLRSNRAVVRHEAPLGRQDVVDLDAFRLTAPDRTLVDYVAGRTFLSGACAMESALHSGLTDRDRIDRAIARRRPFRGSRKVEAVARFASEHSASPNETLCRVRFHELGFAQPEQQKRYTGRGGQHYWVDFYWPEFDVICESDGRVKYEDPRFLAGRTPEQALWDEKLREDELRAQSSGFVRLTWNDAWNRAGLVAKLAGAGIPRRR
ncbi:MAG TPA: type IV toxin-antitoxin system AbiEi family antitoxin domain-containing protein [Pseudolysinimonas sp.]|nr:type IV toxin-antitoxin system AbiEi family antitoxin domain-containing protein [Pseudolysinimonas sp.]